jgi:ATP-dependent helicase/nuclease subunit A
MSTAIRDASALAAIDPRHNAVVHAAAGTGKTWLLVSRVIRLLLQGVTPSSILAITFTRKAAAEMRLRVGQRLLSMCQASEAELRTMLETIGVAANAQMRSRARRLYEELLVAPHELRATTFHAFCQELLTRFAFEAGVPPAFEVVEQTAEMESAAWRALDADLAGADAELSAAMDRLLHSVGGLDNTRRAMREFLAHRSDWWAYTESDADPIDAAARRLQDALHIDPAKDPVEGFANDPEVRTLVQVLVRDLGRNTQPAHTLLHARLQNALAANSAAVFYRLIFEAMYTKKKAPRAFSIPSALAKLLGPTAAAELTRQREALLGPLEETIAHCKRHATWHRTRDWYIVGTRLLQHFQDAKRADGALDFADLEWFAYRLLNQSQHAQWVQYKLDQRIDHLLVDEFQDTNPTQWRLLLPLLQEMAAGSSERGRSVFLVGDEKQSIYRFRRADPDLFTLARNWLAEHTGADVYDQHISWRSSPAIVRFVNLLFDVPATGLPTDSPDHTLKNFRTHATHREELWGHAELLPIVTRDPAAPAAFNFRNPLEEPRETEEDQRRRQEGAMVAEKIRSLIGRPIYRDGAIRPIGYGDIMILLRRRMHAAAYEAALRHAGIPYVGAGRGTFLRCLEVRDIVDLLRLLISPWENVALATVLRSPIFAASDDDLLALADLGPAASWYDRLMAHYGQTDSASPLARAARLLSAWRAQADRIPVHDLLDRIYFDANVPERYQSAAPVHLRQRIAANLTRLLHLALEADGGRFPSLARFLARLEIQTEEDNESLDAGAEEIGDQVRMLTIHAAKGLESPVVFLLDAARETDGNERGVDALIEWPIDQPRPSSFVLLGRKDDADAHIAQIMERRAHAAFQEESNLLYVALTRAQQMLFVSGCQTGRRRTDNIRAGDPGRGWYGYIERRFEAALVRAETAEIELQLQPITRPDTGVTVNLCGFISHGLPPALPAAPTAPPASMSVDPALTRPFGTLRPPRQTESTEEADESALLADTELAALSIAKQRGIVIHRMLERLTEEGADRERAKQQVQHEFAARMDADLLTECWTEACAVIDAPDLRRFFDPQQYKEARNEVAVLYRTDEREVTGIIDRLVFYDDRLVLIDYKTHGAAADQLPTLVERYTPQLRLYAEGLRRLWPGRQVEAVLEFTASRRNVVVKV